MRHALKILLVHNFYKESGGEDVVFFAEKDLLATHGHEVIPFIVNNDGIVGIWQQARTAVALPYSTSMRKRIARQLQATRPDIVHVHNVFPLITPSVYDACHEAGIPVVRFHVEAAAELLETAYPERYGPGTRALEEDLDAQGLLGGLRPGSLERVGNVGRGRSAQHDRTLKDHGAAATVAVGSPAPGD